MKYVRELTVLEEITLKEMEKKHEKPYVRKRAEAILLSNSGINATELSRIIGKHRNHITNWINKYEKYGFTGLYDKPREGRPPKLNQKILESVNKELNSDKIVTLQSLKSFIKDAFNLNVHFNSIRYQLKKRP